MGNNTNDKPLDNLQEIYSLGKDSKKLTVYKSNPLSDLWTSDITLNEFKIVDVYLSRINSHDPSKKVVVFKKHELENLLGISKINKSVLQERLKHLVSNSITIYDPDSNGYKIVNLFEEAEVSMFNNEVNCIKLSCTQAAMKYFFNIESLGYFKYRLTSAINISSRYSYILFQYIEQNRAFKNSWLIELEELKRILKCDDVKSYKEYKYFKRDILNKCQNELAEKAHLIFNFSSVKKKGIKYIKFDVIKAVAIKDCSLDNNEEIYLSDKDLVIKSNDNIENKPKKKSLSDIYVYSEDDYAGKENYIWVSELDKYKLTVGEIDEIISIICNFPIDKLPNSGLFGNDLTISRYDYINYLVKKIDNYNSKSHINNLFGFIKTVILADSRS